MSITNKRIIYVIVEFIVVELLSFLTQKKLTIETNNMSLKDIVDNAIIYGTILFLVIVIIQVTYWYISSVNKRFTNLNERFKEQDVINKFYNIMLLKFEDTYRGHACRVNENDLELFSNTEKKYLKTFLDEKEAFRVEMKGKNKEFGAFMS